jgi:hypothetical protein
LLEKVLNEEDLEVDEVGEYRLGLVEYEVVYRRAISLNEGHSLNSLLVDSILPIE